MRDLQVFRLEREVPLDHFQCRMTKDVLQIGDIARPKLLSCTEPLAYVNRSGSLSDARYGPDAGRDD
jgi:hypothetical protein